MVRPWSHTPNELIGLVRESSSSKEKATEMKRYGRRIRKNVARRVAATVTGKLPLRVPGRGRGNVSRGLIGKRDLDVLDGSDCVGRRAGAVCNILTHLQSEYGKWKKALAWY